MRRLALLAVLLSAAPAQAAGTVVLVPGSGFSGVGPREEVRLAIGREHWDNWGFRTVEVRYRAGRRGARDVREAVARAQRHGPVCVYGESSGGTWALLAAAALDVACVAVSVAPTDQDTWAESEEHGARVLSTERWPRYFGGPDEDDAFEPLDVWTTAAPAVPVFLLYAAGDQVVPPQQGEVFAPVAGNVRVRVMREGRRFFVHSRVRRADLLRARGLLRAFVDKRI